MTRTILLDTNLLIGAFDPEDGNASHIEAKRRLMELLEAPEIKLAITPLIRYEVLRGAKNVDPTALNEQLNGFHEFEVRGEEARRAAELFRTARQQGKALEKHSFDVFHCVCAELNGLEIDSQDRDIARIQNLIRASNQHA